MPKFTKRQLNLINLSLDIILNEGIQSLTIRNLASRAKVTEPAIYRHFKSKFDILYNILDFFDGNADMFLEMIKINKSNEVDKLKLFFLMNCKRFNHNKAFAIIMFSEEIFITDIRLKNKLNSIIAKQKEVLVSIIDNAQKNGKLISTIPSEHIFILIIGTLRFIVTQWKSDNFKNNLEELGISYWKSIETILLNKSEEKNNK